MDSYYAFIFRGLLTEAALDKAGRKNKVINNANLDSEIVQRLPFELLDDDLIVKARSMATVYTAITAFENSVREFVSSKLKEEFNEEWWQKGITDKIRKKAETRKLEEEKIKWHTQRGINLINYVEFGDLVSIIIKGGSKNPPQKYRKFLNFVMTTKWGKTK